MEHGLLPSMCAFRDPYSSEGDEYSDGSARRTCWVPEVRWVYINYIFKRCYALRRLAAGSYLAVGRKLKGG